MMCMIFDVRLVFFPKTNRRARVTSTSSPRSWVPCGASRRCPRRPWCHGQKRVGNSNKKRVGFDLLDLDTPYTLDMFAYQTHHMYMSILFTRHQANQVLHTAPSTPTGIHSPPQSIHSSPTPVQPQEDVSPFFSQFRLIQPSDASLLRPPKKYIGIAW